MYVCALYVRTYVYTYGQSIHTYIRSYEWTAHTYIHTYVCAHIVHTLYIRTYVCKVHTYIRIYFHMHGQYICTYVWTVVCVGRFVRDPVFTEGRHLLLNGPSVYESAPFAFDMYRMYVCIQRSLIVVPCTAVCQHLFTVVMYQLCFYCGTVLLVACTGEAEREPTL